MSTNPQSSNHSAEVPEAIQHFSPLATDEPTVLSDRELREWEQWSSEPTHVAIFRRVERFWRQLDRLPPGLQQTVEGADQDGYDGSVPLEQWLAKSQRPGMNGVTRSTTLYAIAASTLLAVAAVIADYSKHASLWGSHRHVNESLSTVVERRVIDLPDHSRVTLGARTEVSIRYTATERLITLTRGEAWFAVAPDMARPFKVIAGSASIVALGTEFNVDLDAQWDRITVTVGSGEVEVRPVEAHDADSLVRQLDEPVAWAPARLRKGQAVSYGSRGLQEAPQSADVGAVAAWTEGRLEYHHTPLSVVIPSVSRYSEKPIVIEDGAAGDLEFSGTVFEGKVPGWLHALESVYPIRITEDGKRISIHSIGPTSDE